MGAEKEGSPIKMIRRPSRNETVRGLFHPVAVEFAVQRGDADAQQAGGFGLVAPGVLQHPENVAAFEVVERQRIGGGGAGRRTLGNGRDFSRQRYSGSYLHALRLGRRRKPGAGLRPCGEVARHLFRDRLLYGNRAGALILRENNGMQARNFSGLVPSCTNFAYFYASKSSLLCL